MATPKACPMPVPRHEYRIRWLAGLVLFIVVVVALYVIILCMYDFHLWRHVRILTMQERERLVAKYGKEAAVYKYVVVHPASKIIDGHAVTVTEGFITDGLTCPVCFDVYGEREFVLHDAQFGRHAADDGHPLTQKEVDSVLKRYPDRYIAVREGLVIGDQYL
jgi:hypothetical protein